DRPGGHIFAQAGEKRPLLVHGVELARALRRQARKLGRDEFEAAALEFLQDVADEPATNRVRLDDGKRPFDHNGFTSEAPLSSSGRSMPATGWCECPRP